MNATDKYHEVTSEIIDSIKDGSGKDQQDKIVMILKDNFNLNDEMMGKALMKDVLMFELDSGFEFSAPMFITPLFYPRATYINSKLFPNFDIDNKYIGYTENGKFYRNNFIRRFIRHIKKEPFWYLFIFTFYILILSFLIRLK